MIWVEKNQDYEAYRDLWNGNNLGYFDPAYQLLVDAIKFFTDSFEYGFVVMSMLPILVLLCSIKRLGVNWFTTLLIIVSLIPAYGYGPVRQALANSILLLAFSVKRFSFLIEIVSILTHWTAGLPSAMLMITHLKPNLKVLGLILSIGLLYLLGVDWLEARLNIFFEPGSYISWTSIIFKLAILAGLMHAIKNKVIKFYLITKIALISSIIINFMGFFGFGQNIVQRIGMSLDIFAIYALSVIFIYSSPFIKRFWVLALCIKSIVSFYALGVAQ
jgi:hypothetical protein